MSELTNEEQLALVEQFCVEVVYELQHSGLNDGEDIDYEMHGYVGTVHKNNCRVNLTYDPDDQRLEAEYYPVEPGGVVSMVIDCRGHQIPDVQPIADWL